MKRKKTMKKMIKMIKRITTIGKVKIPVVID
jgi:hypothetical protein